MILPPLEALTGMTILVDHRELHQALAPFSSLKTTVQGNHEPIDDILNQLLANVEILPLTYRIIDSETLEITTFEAASQPEEMTVEVHFFETAEFPLQDDESPEEWAETLKLAIAPESWYRADKPETRGGGDIVIDRPSGCALIRQSQPVQRAIRVWLLHKNNPTASSEVPTPAESER